MELPIKPLAPADEELLVTYRLSHPTADLRSLTKRIAGTAVHLLTPSSDPLGSRRALEVETTKHVWTMKRCRRAVDVQQREARSLERRSEDIANQLADERSALTADQSRLADARRRSERFRRCEALVETLGKKRQTRAQLDDLINRLQADIASQSSRREAFIAEAQSRREKFAEVADMLLKIREMPRTDPERSVEKVEAVAAIQALDPAAPVFKPLETTPTVATVLPRNPTLPARPAQGRSSAAPSTVRRTASSVPSLPLNPRKATTPRRTDDTEDGEVSDLPTKRARDGSDEDGGKRQRTTRR